MSAALKSLMRDTQPASDDLTAFGGLVAFLMVGGSGAATFVVLSTLLIWLDTGVAPWLINGACYAALIVPVYLMQRRWAFRTDASHWQALPRYLAVQGMAVLLAALFSYVLYGLHVMPTIFTSMLVIALTSGVNFLVLRNWAMARPVGLEPVTA